MCYPCLRTPVTHVSGLYICAKKLTKESAPPPFAPCCTGCANAAKPMDGREWPNFAVPATCRSAWMRESGRSSVGEGVGRQHISATAPGRCSRRGSYLPTSVWVAGVALPSHIPRLLVPDAGYLLHPWSRVGRLYCGQRAVPTAPRKTGGPDPSRPPVLGATEGGKTLKENPKTVGCQTV